MHWVPRGRHGSTLVGVYLHGSFALGDADIHSDVDFLVVIKDELDHAAGAGDS